MRAFKMESILRSDPTISNSDLILQFGAERPCLVKPLYSKPLYSCLVDCLVALRAEGDQILWFVVTKPASRLDVMHFEIR